MIGEEKNDVILRHTCEMRCEEPMAPWKPICAFDIIIAALFFQPTYKILVKVKAIPLQAWTGPEGSRRLSLPDLKTFGS